MKGKGFTLIELVVVISIITTLAGILLPALVRAREQGRRAVCMNNLHNIGIALSMYQEDFDGFYPGNNVEYAQLYAKKYIETAKTFWCPSDIDPPPEEITPENINISYNFRYEAKLMDSYLPGMGGASTIWAGCDLTPIGKRNHGKDGGNVLFFDGSVGWHRFGPDGNYSGIIR